jgi:beta-fructofuranosidase
MLLLCAFGAIAAIAVASPSQTSSAFDSGVPTGTPVPGNYSGSLRPQIHFSPPKNFMNDPNGCFRDANGTWHLYYQCRSLEKGISLKLVLVVGMMLDVY